MRNRDGRSIVSGREGGYGKVCVRPLRRELSTGPRQRLFSGVPFGRGRSAPLGGGPRGRRGAVVPCPDRGRFRAFDEVRVPGRQHRRRPRRQPGRRGLRHVVRHVHAPRRSRGGGYPPGGEHHKSGRAGWDIRPDARQPRGDGQRGDDLGRGPGRHGGDRGRREPGPVRGARAPRYRQGHHDLRRQHGGVGVRRGDRERRHPHRGALDDHRQPGHGGRWSD